MPPLAAVSSGNRPWRRGEGATVAWSFLYFFFLLAGYYVLRPVRDTLAIVGGTDDLPWLFTATFLAMLAAVPLYGWLTGRYPRKVFVPAIYLLFIIQILIFYALRRMDVAPQATAAAFFVWTSVFNLFVVSVFWSFMADLYSSEQARRLFAFIAAGGSLGAIAGPLLASLLAGRLGTDNLLAVAALVLCGALLAISRLRRRASTEPAGAAADSHPLGGSSLEGVRRLLQSRYLLGIGAFIVLYTMIATFLYFQQAELIAGGFESNAARTTVFARIDLAVNTLTLLLQLALAHRIIQRFGLATALAAVPMIAVAGFAVLALAPVFATLATFQVLRRAGNYALTRPARETLFTFVGRRDRYKSKNVIDTVVYRGGDAVSGWLFAGLGALGLGVRGTALVAIPAAMLWAGLALWLGRPRDRGAAASASTARYAEGDTK